MLNKNEIAVFGGGCFWCTEAVFALLRGVVSVSPGYAGGTVPNPSYEQVHSGKTGHAEVVKIEFGSSEISYKELLEVFFSAHDPTTLDKQGHDVGEQYRSIIFYTSEEQERDARAYVGKLNDGGEYNEPVVTKIESLVSFYEAGDDHKDYFLKNPEQAYCQVVIAPKVDKVIKKYGKLLK